MDKEKILDMSRTSYDPTLHRTETLQKRAGVTFAQAWQLLKSVRELTELNPCRFVAKGNQGEMSL